MLPSRYEAVTLPLLVPAKFSDREGTVSIGRGLAGVARFVRRFTAADLTLKTEQGKKSFGGLSAAQRERFLGAIALLDATDRRDGAAIQKACGRLADVDDPFIKGLIVSICKDRPRNQVIETLSDLPRVRFVLWAHKDQLVPALLCQDIATAYYIRALLRVASREAFNLCARCGAPFIRKRKNQVYCSPKCREAHRQARHRHSPSVAQVRHKR